MPLSEKLLFRQSLQRSAKEWLRIYREELKKARPHGLGSDGQPKSRFSPVSADSIASGRILDASYEVVDNEKGSYDVIFGLPGYILALDRGQRGGRFKYGQKRGRGGTSKLLQSIKDWIETKGIKSQLSTESLAFAIRTNILKDGVMGTNILTTVNQRFMEEYGEQIAQGYFTDMEDYIINNIQRIEERFR